jgi:4-hydroxy-tetrahydrodipicolinate reductase
MRILLVGARGRMGQAVAAAVERDETFTVGAAIDQGDLLSPAIETCDLAIDFSAAAATPAVCRACAEHHRPLVLGTTGQNAEQKEAVAAAARIVPVVFAANFSLGARSCAPCEAEMLKSQLNRFARATSWVNTP